MVPNPIADGSRPAVEAARLRLDRLADRTADLPLPEVLRRVCEAAADALAVERAGIWLFVDGDKTLRCVCLFERSKRRHSKGACLALANPSEYLRAVAETPLLACALARSDPRTAELGDSYLAPNGITSLLDAPLMRDDRFVGVVCHEHVGPPREWTDDDRVLALGVADLVVAQLKSAEGGLRCSPKPVQGPKVGPFYPALGGAVHDLRNIFTEILSNAEMCAHSPDLPPGVLDGLRKICDAVERGAALLRVAPVTPIQKADDDTGEHQPLPASTSV